MQELRNIDPDFSVADFDGKSADICGGLAAFTAACAQIELPSVRGAGDGFATDDALGEWVFRVRAGVLNGKEIIIDVKNGHPKAGQVEYDGLVLRDVVGRSGQNPLFVLGIYELLWFRMFNAERFEVFCTHFTSKKNPREVAFSGVNVNSFDVYN
jgi:hypothetical protein